MPLFGFEQHRPSVHEAAFVAPTATIIGDVTIEADASVWYGSVLRGDYGSIFVRAGANVQDGTVIHGAPGFATDIGARATIGHNCVIHSARIGEDALVGNAAAVLDGAEVGSSAVIAAGSVVTPGSRIPDGAFAAGVPAEVKRTTEGTSHEIWAINAKAYISLASRHRSGVWALDDAIEATQHAAARDLEETSDLVEQPGKDSTTNAPATPDVRSFRYLSDAWVTEMGERCNADSTFRERAIGQSVRVEVETLGGPEGDASWWYIIEDGKMQTGGGSLPNPDLKYSLDWETAIAIETQQLSTDKAFFDGRLRAEGDFKKLTDLQPLFQALDAATAGIVVHE